MHSTMNVEQFSEGDSEGYLGLEEGWSQIYSAGVQPFLAKIETGLDSKAFERQSIQAQVFIQVYDLVFRMCIQREPENWSEQLYDRYVSSLTTFLQNSAVPALAAQQQTHELAFLREWCHRWQGQVMAVKGLQKMFMYLDRFYVQNNDEVPALARKGFQVFKQQVYERFSGYARQCLLKCVQEERSGKGQDRDLLGQTVKVFVELGFRLGVDISLYREDIEKSLVKEAKDTYRVLGREWLEQDSCPEYLCKVESVLAQEQTRLQGYLHHTSAVPLLGACRDVLLKEVQTELLQKQSGLSFMLEQELSEDLSRMYQLFLDVEQGRSPIAQAIKEHVKKLGFRMVADAKANRGKAKADQHQLIRQLIGLHQCFQAIVHSSFRKDQLFEKALKESFEEFVNKELYVSHSLAQFVDALLTQGSRLLSPDKDLAHTLDHIVTLYGYLRDKDLFEEQYHALLSLRLLAGTSFSLQAERTLIAKLKAECGYQWAAKLETMFKDVQRSQELCTEFQSWAGKGFETELDVVVCQSGSWPSASVSNCGTLSTELQPVAEKYKSFYLSKHSGRKLGWALGQGQAEVNVVFSNEEMRGKLLLVSTYQMMILLLFNHSRILTFSELQAQTQIPREELEVQVLSLAHPSMKVLKKNPNRKEISPDDKFMLNKAFEKKAFRVRVPLLRMGGKSASGGNDEELSKQIKVQRNHQIDAAIVRIMKTRQRLEHSKLVAEVLKHLQRFQPQGEHVKRRIETMIEQDYLERDSEDRRVYHYLA